MAVAAMPPARRKMTKEEFKQLPEGPPYYEYEFGEVIEVARLHPFHNIIVGCLFAFLYNFVQQHQLGLVKFRQYLRVGVEWLWLIEPETLTIEEYRAQNGHYVALARVAAGEVCRPALFPELEINLQTLIGAASEATGGNA